MNPIKNKTVEDVGYDLRGDNSNNPNPYIRKYGSLIKSHFSYSGSEIFNFCDKEINKEFLKHSDKNQHIKNFNNFESLNFINEIDQVFDKTPYTHQTVSVSNLNSMNQCPFENFNTESNDFKNISIQSPSIKNVEKEDFWFSDNHKRTEHNILEENNISINNNPDDDVDSLEADLQELDNDDSKSQLVILGSRKSSFGSFRSIDFDTNNLKEISFVNNKSVNIKLDDKEIEIEDDCNTTFDLEEFDYNNKAEYNPYLTNYYNNNNFNFNYQFNSDSDNVDYLFDENKIEEEF